MMTLPYDSDLTSRTWLLLVTSSLLLPLGLVGCDSPAPSVAPEETTAEAAPTPTAPPPHVAGDDGSVTIAELRDQLGVGQSGEIRKVGGEIVAMDMRQTAISDLAPLHGLPLRHLFLEETKVTDLTPLAGMPLEQLYLSNTKVTDLSPLAGMSIKELNLVGTPLENLTSLQEVAIGTLWIPQTKVSDLSPLAGKSLVSLDVQDTPVSDLTPLKDCSSLRRLHLGGTAVTDLSPLAGLELERLIFSPEKITAGLDAVRNMTSLRGLDVAFDGSKVMPPEQFWQRYDAGEWAGSDQSPPE